MHNLRANIPKIMVKAGNKQMYVARTARKDIKAFLEEKSNRDRCFRSIF